MILRGLLCAALLWASSLPAQPTPALPATQQEGNTQAAPTQQGAAQAPATQEQEGSAQQPEGAEATAPSADETMPPMHLDCTPAARAHTLIGKHGCVAGRVFRVTYTRLGNARIYLCPHTGECSFHATVYAIDKAEVGELLYLRGKVVAIVGDVTEFRGVPQIVIGDPDQIQVVAGDAPHEFDSSVARPRRKGKHRLPVEHAW